MLFAVYMYIDWTDWVKELELENGKDGLLPLINVFSAICVNFIYGGRVRGIPPIRPQLIGVN